MTENRYADVILPLYLPNTFTYRIPAELTGLVQTGCRVIVQFGAKKIVTAVVCRLHDDAPAYDSKEILELLEEQPSVNTYQLKLFQWMADYYMCTIGEVLNAALPAGLKLNSESRVQINPLFEEEGKHFTEKEQALLAALRGTESLLYSDIARLLEVKSVYPILKSLIAKEAILLYEQVKDKYQPKRINKIKLNPVYASNQEALQRLLDLLEKKPKQADVILQYLQLVPVYRNPELNEEGVSKKELTDRGISDSSLSTLIKNRIFDEFEIIISRFGELNRNEGEWAEVTLSEPQTEARNQILEHFNNKNTVLLHGITGSGKTEIYIDLIQKTLESGSQVLYLLPEIALTTQIVSRLQKVFGNRMGVYHSKFSDNERVEVWKGIISGRFQFVVGVRSAIFLPFDNLGLIILDEEHEPSYKQHEPAPRYHARETAMMMAHLQKSKTLLGSATPSIETFYLAQKGKFGLVQLFQRFGKAQLPRVIIADMREKKSQDFASMEYSEKLVNSLSLNLENSKQSILFQNRRGYSPYITCDTCGWISECRSCNVSLTYHLYKNELRCHYCGHSERIPKTCNACGSPQLKTMGIGTEKIEEDLKLLFPTARVQRMDLETTRSKFGYQQIIEAFEHGHVDILVGTQMVSKGLDFDNVTLVGIIDADRMMYFPDFRAEERTFQLLSQVSGRAGRRGEEGKVVIQTRTPQQPLLHLIATNDYTALYNREITEREKFNYPPFTRLIKLTLRSEKKEVVESAARKFAGELKRKLGATRVLGPESPLIDKIRNLYIKEIMIKLERDKIDLTKVKILIKEEVLSIQTDNQFKNKVQVMPDVDPV